MTLLENITKFSLSFYAPSVRYDRIKPKITFANETCELYLLTQPALLRALEVSHTSLDQHSLRETRTHTPERFIIRDKWGLALPPELFAAVARATGKKPPALLDNRALRSPGKRKKSRKRCSFPDCWEFQKLGVRSRPDPECLTGTSFVRCGEVFEASVCQFICLYLLMIAQGGFKTSCLLPMNKLKEGTIDGGKILSDLKKFLFLILLWHYKCSYL